MIQGLRQGHHISVCFPYRLIKCQIVFKKNSNTSISSKCVIYHIFFKIFNKGNEELIIGGWPLFINRETMFVRSPIGKLSNKIKKKHSTFSLHYTACNRQNINCCNIIQWCVWSENPLKEYMIINYRSLQILCQHNLYYYICIS